MTPSDSYNKIPEVIRNEHWINKDWIAHSWIESQSGYAIFSIENWKIYDKTEQYKDAINLVLSDSNQENRTWMISNTISYPEWEPTTENIEKLLSKNEINEFEIVEIVTFRVKVSDIIMLSIRAINIWILEKVTDKLIEEKQKKHIDEIKTLRELKKNLKKEW